MLFLEWFSWNIQSPSVLHGIIEFIHPSFYPLNQTFQIQII